MKVLLDEMLPRPLKKALGEHQVFTIQEMGWKGIKNGELLKRASNNFQVFITADKNLRYQQNLKRLNLAVIVFASNRLSEINDTIHKLSKASVEISTGEIIEL